MGYKQRERKRKQKAARKQAQAEGRRSGTSASKWWLTKVTRDTCCARCAQVLRVGKDMVYRRAPRETVCVMCADNDPAVTYRLSVRWENARLRSRS